MYYAYDYYNIVINMVYHVYLYQWKARSMKHAPCFLFTFIEDKITYLFTPQRLKLEFSNQIESYIHLFTKLAFSSLHINHNDQFGVLNSYYRHISEKYGLLNLS